MSDKNIVYTSEQIQAIENRGGALLVSAAAGSGKTKVLVERLLSRVADSQAKCNIDDFLIITYTKAAAAELRGKIQDGIAQRLAKEPENRHLRRQLNLCRKAEIETIHSFCVGVLRENAHKIDISPDFRVCDETESGIIKLRAIDAVLEEKYSDIANNPGFALLVDMMGAGRDDSMLVSIVLDTYDKLGSHPYPEKWVEKQLELLNLDNISDVSETPWGEYLIGCARFSARYWTARLEKLRREAEIYPDFDKAYGPSLDAALDSARAFIAAMKADWDTAWRFGELDVPRPRPIKEYEQLKAERTRCTKALGKLCEMFDAASKELLADMRIVAPVAKELLDLVMDFDQAYAKEKKRLRLIDFSDQEHMAVRLLCDSETGAPTRLAMEISKRYTEIMVDEYQDVNAVQDLIFNAVSKSGKNIFMVGDVKQSIYRFRLADPSIFLKKYNSFIDAGGAQDGEERKVILSKNFRSRQGVLECVNYVFRNIMSQEFGEMDYTQREYLYPGAKYPQGGGPAVELDVINLAQAETDDGETPDKTDTEAEFVAQRISELMKTQTVFDPDGMERKLDYGDVAILLRSVKEKAPKYAAALARHGIPSSLDKSGGFFETIEITIMLSLLAVIDNPHQDIPLISVLRSPVYCFTADELAETRVFDKNADFYSALVAASNSIEKCKSFLDELDGYRSIAPDMRSDELIWHIYNKTGIMGIMGAMHGGGRRRDNLMLLFEYARRYEAAGYRGLFSFITYIRQIKERGADPEAETLASGEGVRLMSIHKSKGLEFPVVILADLSKRFNMEDSKKPLLVHPELGVGPKMLDMQRRIEYPTIARSAIAKKLSNETRAEEMRVLYVAMTRAREKLIMVCTFADAQKQLESLMKDAELPIPPQVVENAKSMADWILLPALIRPEASPLRTNQSFAEKCDFGEKWEIRLVTPEDHKRFINGRTKQHSAIEITPDDVEKIAQKLSFIYPYMSAVNMPSKLTATELKGRFSDVEAAEEAERVVAKERSIPLKRPDFISERLRLTGAEAGIALHLVMQYIDFAKCMDVGGVEEEIDRLVISGIVTREQADSVSAQKVWRFFSSNIGKRVVFAKKLYREFKFSLLVPSSEIVKTDCTDSVLLQGVVDCCIDDADSLTIIDFKTDYVNKSTFQEITKHYSGQLDAYALAMKRITGKTVKEKILYFFGIDEAVIV